MLDETSIYNYALLQAALHADIDIIDACLNHGADVNTTDAYGNTALILVSKSRYAITPKLVSLLLSRGANPNHHAQDNITTAHTAASVGNTEVMELLYKTGARLDVRDTKLRTPMIVAAMQHQQKSIERLIAWGLGVNDYDQEGNTPLIYAFQNGDRVSANLLLSNGADIYHRNRQNNNAASVAWNRQDKDMLDMLYVYSSGNASFR